MIKAIMACDSSFGIGKNGSLPWPKNSDDLGEFKELTTGHVVLMGAKTWKDPVFPKPLPNRKNYVLTRNKEFYDNRCLIVNDNHLLSIQSIAEECETLNKTLWVIGGSEILNMMLPLIKEFHLTIFDENYNCDKFIDNPLDHGFIEKSFEKRHDCTKYIYVK